MRGRFTLMFQAQSLHPYLTSHLSPSAHRAGISEIPRLPPRPMLPPPRGQFLCLLTHLSMQGYHMTFSSRNPHQVGSAWLLSLVDFIFPTIKAHRLRSGPQEALCKRVTDVSREKGRRGGAWVLISGNQHLCFL